MQKAYGRYIFFSTFLVINSRSLLFVVMSVNYIPLKSEILCLTWIIKSCRFRFCKGCILWNNISEVFFFSKEISICIFSGPRKLTKRSISSQQTKQVQSSINLSWTKRHQINKVTRGTRTFTRTYIFSKIPQLNKKMQFFSFEVSSFRWRN